MPSIRLTNRAIQALRLPSGKGEEYFWDAGLPGFGVRLRASASGAQKPYFLVQYRNASGTSRKVGIGYSGMPWTLDTARDRARELLTAVGKGGDPAEARRQRRLEQTFGECFADYIVDRSRGTKPLAASTVLDYESIYAHHVKAPLGARKVSEVTHAEVMRLRAAIAKAGGVRTPDKAVLLVKSVYRWLQAQGLKIDSPAAAIRVAPSRHAAKALTPQQTRALMRALEDEANAGVADLFRVAMLTGMRRGNLSAMRWDELDLANGLWIIPKTKNGSAHTAMLPAPLVDLLRSRQENVKGPWVFPSVGRDGELGHVVSLHKPWQRCLLRARMYLLIDRLAVAGIEFEPSPAATTAKEVARLDELAAQANLDTSGTDMQFRIHDLRASFATTLSQSQSTVVMAQMLGHKTLAMAQRYAQTQEDTHRRASDQAFATIMADAGLAASAEVIPFPKRTASN